MRSLSSSGYNMIQQSVCTAEALKEELEKLVEEATPKMNRPNAIRVNNIVEGIVTSATVDGTYRRMKSRSRTKMQKSMSSNAVLESDSESNTPQHVARACTSRPLSEVIQPTTLLSIGTMPLDEEINNDAWTKRHTVHESMSYYSLCFPSPQPGSDSSSSSVDNAQQRLSLTYDGQLDNNCQGVDDDIANGNIRQGISPNYIGKENTITTLIDLDDNNVISSPTDGRPKSSGYNSLGTLYTPSVESRGISHSVSHNSGYHSFTDDTFYEHKEFADILQQQQIHQPMTISRRLSQRFSRDTSMELKHLNARNASDVQNQNVFAENGQPIPLLRHPKEVRARSWDRSSLRRESTLRNSGENGRSSWQPQINAIKEVVVPGSPASRKWSNSPARSKHQQHHWQLCMFVFGGREVGVTGIYKQPISIWKLYI